MQRQLQAEEGEEEEEVEEGEEEELFRLTKG